MIITGTRINVADNSGARTVGCIKVLGSHKYGIIGDYLIVSVKKCIPHKKVKKHEIFTGILIRQSFPFPRINGSKLVFSSNDIVLINKKGEPLGSRVFGPIPYELRRKKFMKIISISASIV